MKCIFCDITKGKRKAHENGLPAIPLYQDEDIFSMLSIYKPTDNGFDILVLPKQHFEFIQEVPEAILIKLISKISKFSGILKNKYGGSNIVQNNGRIAGQTVFHTHFHIIPRKKGDDINLVESINRLDLNEKEIIEKSKELIKHLKQF